MKKSINVSDAMVLSKMSERYYTQTEADGVIKDFAFFDGTGFRGRKHVRFYSTHFFYGTRMPYYKLMFSLLGVSK